MAIKIRGRPADPRVFEWPGGFTWLAHPAEAMERASHAIGVTVDGRPAATAADVDAVWVVEPIDYDGLDDRLETLGPVAGVVVLASFHRRDATAVAGRHDVPVHLAGTVGRLASRIDGPTRVFRDRLAGTGFKAIPVMGGIPWSESVLYDGSTGTLVATEVLVSSDAATGPGERAAVSPFVRLFPPRAVLGTLSVSRLLFGHGPPILDDAQSALDGAMAECYRGFPAYVRNNFRYMLRGAYTALRD